MPTYILEIDSVRKAFGDRIVLSDVWLRLGTGQIIGLLGRNGSGKSTLLKIMAGEMRAEQSFLHIYGKPVSSPASRIAYLPQTHFVPPQLSVEKAAKLSVEKEQLSAFFEDSIVRPLARQKIGQLSQGQRRYVEIRLSLFHHADFLLLDEPFNGLSPKLIEAVNSTIRECAGQKAIIVTDHHYRHVLDISTDLVLLKDGKTHTIDQPFQLIEKGYLSEGML